MHGWPHARRALEWFGVPVAVSVSRRRPHAARCAARSKGRNARRWRAKIIFASGPGGNSPGTINVLPQGETQVGPSRHGSTIVPVRHDRYVWRAPRDLPGPLPSDRSVRLDVYTARDGIRRFVPCPEDGLDGFVARAFQYGHSLLARDRNFDWERWCDYLIGKLAYDRLLRVQERVRRTFHTADSLQIGRGLRDWLGYASVLPDHIGRTASGAGKPWSVNHLLEEGRRAARELGISTPTEADAVTYGLYAAARLNPLRIPDRDQVSSLMRMALYDYSRIESRVSDAEREEVLLRFRDLIREHLHDERQQFWGWFAGGHSNLIKAIANRRDSSGRKLSPAVVKRALHDLGWRGYQQVGECIEAFARAFARALPLPHRAQEIAYLEALYCRQDYLGGLPLVLVMERQALIRPAVLELWENPADEATIGALHQALSYFTEMVEVSRKADRTQKQNVPGLCIHDGTSDLERSGETDGPSAQEVFQHLIELHRISCPQCERSPTGTLASTDIRPESPVQLDVRCDVHGLIRILEIPWAELTATRAIFEDERRVIVNRSDRRRRSPDVASERD